ncbi:hypothetical protein G9A89_011964 [Geosiphon pyriformis]|nr:hypothetical protein G9A89_011964 [Geosiphon pyriformis]
MVKNNKQEQEQEQELYGSGYPVNSIDPNTDLTSNGGNIPDNPYSKNDYETSVPSTKELIAVLLTEFYGQTGYNPVIGGLYTSGKSDISNETASVDAQPKVQGYRLGDDQEQEQISEKINDEN